MVVYSSEFSSLNFFLPYFHLLFLHFLDGNYGWFYQSVILFVLKEENTGGLMNILSSEDNQRIYGTDVLYFERCGSAS